jgi:hypothetical protein
LAQPTADFNGDGKTDIVWRNAIGGATAMWFMDGSTIVQAQACCRTPTGVTHAGDLNGDGKAD